MFVCACKTWTLFAFRKLSLLFHHFLAAFCDSQYLNDSPDHSAFIMHLDQKPKCLAYDFWFGYLCSLNPNTKTYVSLVGNLNKYLHVPYAKP